MVAVPRIARACAALGAVVTLTAGCGAASGAHPSTSPRRSPHSAQPARSVSGSTTATSSSTATPDASNPPAGAVRRADAWISHLTASLGRGGVSVEALDTATGTTFSFGARRGMRTASIAKLYILEAVLLRHQRSGASRHVGLLTRMIENSDNDAANDLYVDIGEGRGLRGVAAALGVRHTVPGEGIYWGFTETDAADYVALLRDLIGPGALSWNSRHLALHLLSHVESDQRWGVGAVADHGTTFYNKNGWLAASPDDYRWIVNSVGIVTVHGQQLLMAVLTQHGGSFSGGVTLTEHLAHVLAKVVTTS